MTTKEPARIYPQPILSRMPVMSSSICGLILPNLICEKERCSDAQLDSIQMKLTMVLVAQVLETSFASASTKYLGAMSSYGLVSSTLLFARGFHFHA